MYYGANELLNFHSVLSTSNMLTLAGAPHFKYFQFISSRPFSLLHMCSSLKMPSSLPSSSSTICFYVNGAEVRVENPDPELTLAYFLRNQLNLTGTKLACEEGACGACTVALAKWNADKKKSEFFSANACVVPLFLVDRHLVLTVEGIGTPQRLHAVQQRIAMGHGTQCGFCSPGFVMSAYALLRNHPEPTMEQIKTSLVGNLCRCTGYRPILEALQSFGKDKKSGCCMSGGGRGCCPCKEAASEGGSSSGQPPEMAGLVSYESFAPYDPSSEIIFPPALILEATGESSPPQTLSISGKRVSLVAPATMDELAAAAKAHPPDRVISSGLMTRLLQSMSPAARAASTSWLSIHRIAELATVSASADEIVVGSSLSLRSLVAAIHEHCTVEEYRAPIVRLYRQYSSDQIKNVASWAGALASASASSDLCTLFLGLSWRVRLFNFATASYHTLSAAEFFAAPKTCLAPTDIIISLHIPTTPKERIATFKVGQRLGGDDTVVNSVTSLHTDTGIVRVAMGLYRKPILLEKTSAVLGEMLKSNASESDLKSAAKASLHADLSVFAEQPGFEYKQSLALAAVLEAFLVLGHKDSHEGQRIAASDLEPTQLYRVIPKEQSPEDPVGRPLAHIYADRHTSGQAAYVGDIKEHGMLHLALVHSTVAHGKVLSVDPSEALGISGVVDYIDIKDIPAAGTNQPGLMPHMHLRDNTPIFADGLVECHSQPIGAIVAEDVVTARRAAKLVRVQYEQLPAVLTIEDALEQSSFLSPDAFVFGQDLASVDKALEECGDRVVAGRAFINGQEHMYMETQSTLVVPGENDELTVTTSSQHPAGAQYLIAAALGIQANNIVVKVKRCGGAFGGKGCSDSPPRLAAAVAAAKLRRPISVVLHRNDDILSTGKRHPVEADYRVGFDSNGRVKVAFIKYYVDCGYSFDHSLWVTPAVASMGDACFKIPVMRTEAYALKTNKHSNTAFRGYGRPQAFFIMECILSRVAHSVGKSLEEVKEINFARTGDATLFGMPIQNDALIECWEECKRFSRYEQLCEQVNHFNKNSQCLKRGVSMSATRFGLTHPGPMEQGTALVQLFIDGTARIAIGAVEMGQGVTVKCQQIAARALEMPIDCITILEMATDKTANTMESGGSIGTDVNGQAVRKACERLRAGVLPFLKEHDFDWRRALKAALEAKVALQASEHIEIERKSYGMPEGHNPYFTTGAACVVAEIDPLTGEHKLLTVDIVMDVGDSINPAIDIGQIEGGFIQGYGLHTSETLEYNAAGKLTTNSAYTYKIPTVHMVPERFRVKLLQGAPNYAGQIYGSKGIGEPPLLLGCSAYSAIRNAILAARQAASSEDNKDFLQLDAPLTAKAILKACQA